MNNATLFCKAHNLAKSIIQAGDNYAVTFGACLKFIRSQMPKVDTQWVKRMWDSSKEMFSEYCSNKRANTIAKQSMLEDCITFELHAYAEILSGIVEFDTIKEWYNNGSKKEVLRALKSICIGLECDNHFSIPFYNRILKLI